MKSDSYYFDRVSDIVPSIPCVRRCLLSDLSQLKEGKEKGLEERVFH